MRGSGKNRSRGTAAIKIPVFTKLLSVTHQRNDDSLDHRSVVAFDQSMQGEAMACW